MADKLSVPIEKRVYPLASSENNHMIPTLQRPNLIEPAGMHLAAKFIIDICNKNNLIPNLYDLYSCFPVAVQMFAKSLQMQLVVGARKRLHLLKTKPELRKKLWSNVNLLQNGLKDRGFDIGTTKSCVTPVFLKGDVPEAMVLVKDLREKFNIFCSINFY